MTVESKQNMEVLNKFVAKSQNLIHLLKKEAEYYSAARIGNVEKLNESKQILTEQVSAHRNYLVQNVDFLKSLPENTKGKLKKIHQELADSAEQNYKSALYAKEMNKLLVEGITHAFSKQNNQINGYNNHGNLGVNNDNGFSPLAVSESI